MTCRNFIYLFLYEAEFSAVFLFVLEIFFCWNRWLAYDIYIIFPIMVCMIFSMYFIYLFVKYVFLLNTYIFAVLHFLPHVFPMLCIIYLVYCNAYVIFPILYFFHQFLTILSLVGMWMSCFFSLITTSSIFFLFSHIPLFLEDFE